MILNYFPGSGKVDQLKLWENDPDAPTPEEPSEPDGEEDESVVPED